MVIGTFLPLFKWWENFQPLGLVLGESFPSFPFSFLPSFQVEKREAERLVRTPAQQTVSRGTCRNFRFWVRFVGSCSSFTEIPPSTLKLLSDHRWLSTPLHSPVGTLTSCRSLLQGFGTCSQGGQGSGSTSAMPLLATLLALVFLNVSVMPLLRVCCHHSVEGTA